MKKLCFLILTLVLFGACAKDELPESAIDNPELPMEVPFGFPELNVFVNDNRPTLYGVQLGEKLFNEKRFSGNNTISCASCHNPAYAFSDQKKQGVGIYDRVGMRNTPGLQNLAFMRVFNWDGNVVQLEKQPLVPIITHEEMNSSIVEVIDKLKGDAAYSTLFRKAFGDEGITPERIYKSIGQYEYTLISANSKYDRLTRGEGVLFTAQEERGHMLFKRKCESCHSGALFSDQTFRNIGFPQNPSTEEAGRARVTGLQMDYMRFRVPSLRNAEYTAPYGSFGQFASLKAVLDYLDAGVIDADNLDPFLKNNGNRIAMNEQEKLDIIAFIKTLSDPTFVKEKEDK